MEHRQDKCYKYSQRKEICGPTRKEVVGSERAKTSTVVDCVNAAGEKMPPLIIHRGVWVPATWTQNAPLYYRVCATKKGYINHAESTFGAKCSLHTSKG